MKLIQAIDDIRDAVRQWRRQDLVVGLVPTMGYLHEGHRSLIRLARQESDRVVVSIFVNPTQFSPTEDLAVYPRDLKADLDSCRAEGVDAVFHPSADAMYADDFSTWVSEERLAGGLCGASRPTHFRGVATVVTKLFNIVQPDIAIFGRKDAQQALVIERLVRDLNVPVQVITAPTVREADGLALSSRNSLLTPEDRARAPAICAALRDAAAALAAGRTDADALKALVTDALTRAGARVDYVELVSRRTLEPIRTVDEQALLAVAVLYGQVRLIDNVFLGD